MDIWSKQKRSEVMSKIKGKNTKPKIILRSQLFIQGFRFRIHKKDLPGKPDIVLSKLQDSNFCSRLFLALSSRLQRRTDSFYQLKILERKTIKKYRKRRKAYKSNTRIEMESYSSLGM